MFLATTALSEFWDKNQEILFLGSWCLRYDRRTDWEGLRYQVMPSPWNDRKRFYDAAHYLDSLAERMLDHLTDYLNAVHHVSYSQRYWRILIGPWLQHYIHAVYDRHVHLIEAFGKFPTLQTIIMAPQCFRVPKDTIESIEFLREDPYNLQLFSQLLQRMGHSCETRMIKKGWTDTREFRREKSRRGWRRTVKSLARRGLTLAKAAVRHLTIGDSYVALSSMYCPRIRILFIASRLGPHAQLFDLPAEWAFILPDPLFDHRRMNFTTLNWRDSFEQLAIQLLPQNFPTLYLEGYESARAETLRKHRNAPLVIVSATGWYTHEPFKFWAAESSERGSRLVAVQHGGGYGIFRFSPDEQHERRLADSYMVWGWADGSRNISNNLPCLMYPESLNNRGHIGANSKTGVILFVATTDPRYLHLFRSNPVGSQWQNYFAWQLGFLSVVPDWLRSAILFRPHMHDFGDATREQISRRFPDVRWDNGEPSHQRLQDSRIVVIDHCTTTFLETLAANIPTVLFWNPNLWEVRNEAEPYFENLRKVGILWDSPEAAAAKVAKVYHAPWTWWGSEAVQEIRRAFVDRFMLVREDWVDCWVKALEEEMAASLVHLKPSKWRSKR